MAEGLIYSPPSPSNPRYHHYHNGGGGAAASPGGRNGADTSRVNYNNATTGGLSATSRSHRRLDVDGLARDSSYYRDAHEQWARGVDTLLRPGMTASHSAALAKWRAAHGIPEPAPAVVDAATTPERSVGPDKLDASVAAGTPGGRVANAFGLMKTRRLQEQLESLCTSDGSGEVDVDRALGILNSVESMLANGGPPAADRSHSRRGISTSTTATTAAASRGASVGQQTATDDATEKPKTRWRSVALNSVNTQTAAPPPPPPPPPPTTAEPQSARTESVNVTASSAMNGSGIDGGPDPSVPRLTRLPPRPADHRSHVPVRPPPHQHHTSSNYNGLSPEDVEAYKLWWQQYRSWYAQGGGNDADVEGAPRHHHHQDESTRTRHHRRDHHRHASAERSRSDSASRQPRHHHHHHHPGGSRSPSVERLIRRASPGYRPHPGRRDDDSDSRDSYDVSRHHHHQHRNPAPHAHHQQQRTPPRARSSSPGLEAAAQWARTQHLHDRQVTRSLLASSTPAATHQRSRDVPPQQPQQQSHHRPLPPSTSRQPMDQSGAATPPRSANVAASAAAAALSSLNVVSPMTDGDTSDEDHGGVGQISAIGRQRGAGRFPETSMASAGGGAYPPPPPYDGDGGDEDDHGGEIDADSQTLPPSSPAANHRSGASRDAAGTDGPTPAFRVQSLAASTAASRSRQAIAMQQRSRTAQRVAPMRSPPRQRNPDYTTASVGRPSAAGPPRGYQHLQAPNRAGTAAMMTRSRSGQPTGPTRR